MKKYDKAKYITLAKRYLPAVLAIILLFAAMIFTNMGATHDNSVNDGSTVERAVVEEVVSGDIVLNDNGVYTGSQTIRARVTSGKYKGEIFESSNTADQYSGVICKEGTHIVLAISESNGTIISFVNGYDNTFTYVALAVLFSLCMILIAGIKGLKALIGLIITIMTLIWLFIPLICQGFSPYWTAVVWAIITTVITMALISGYSTKTLSAVLSTTIGVTVSGVIASIFGAVAHLSGFNMEYAEEIIMLNTETPVKVSGLLFAGILIASLGAVMDVCMSIASAINEIYESNPKMSRKELFRSGMNVGRDTMGTMANTLILAFAGSSLTMIILLYAYASNANHIVSMNNIAIEIIQGISGSIGICLSVPTVSLISSQLVFLKRNKLIK